MKSDRINVNLVKPIVKFRFRFLTASYNAHLLLINSGLAKLAWVQLDLSLQVSQIKDGAVITRLSTTFMTLSDRCIRTKLFIPIQFLLLSTLTYLTCHSSYIFIFWQRNIFFKSLTVARLLCISYNTCKIILFVHH